MYQFQILQESSMNKSMDSKYCFTIFESKNGTISILQQKSKIVNNFYATEDQQFMAFVYTCVIMGYFSFFIMLSMVKGLWEEKRYHDGSLDEILEKIQIDKHNAIYVEEKRRLQMAKQQAVSFIANTSSTRPKRAKSASLPVPKIVVTQPTPPAIVWTQEIGRFNQNSFFPHEHSECSESTSDEGSLVSSNASINSIVD